MKHILTGLTVLLFSFSAFSLDLVVDVQTALTGCKKGKQAKAKFEQKGQKARADITKKAEALKAEYQKLQKDAQAGLLGKEAILKKQQEMAQKEMALKKEDYDKGVALQKEENSEAQKLIAGIMQTAGQIAKNKKANKVFEKSAMIYFDSSVVDITQDVINKFNKQK